MCLFLVKEAILRQSIQIIIKKSKINYTLLYWHLKSLTVSVYLEKNISY